MAVLTIKASVYAMQYKGKAVYMQGSVMVGQCKGKALKR